MNNRVDTFRVRDKRVFLQSGQGKSGNVREFEKQSGKKILKVYLVQV